MFISSWWTVSLLSSSKLHSHPEQERLTIHITISGNIALRQRGQFSQTWSQMYTHTHNHVHT